MKKINSWPWFFTGIGFLTIMTSPQAPNPGIMLFGGIFLVVVSVIWMMKDKKNRKDSEK